MKRHKPVIFILGLLLLAFGALSLARAVKDSDYFKIRQIIIRGNGNIELSYLKGHNIFDLDLGSLAANLEQDYPTFKAIRLVRVMPDRLSVEFLKRQPLAIVKLYRYFCVDSDGVLFEIPQDVEQAQLPLFVGLETRIFGPKPGRAYDIKELNVAIAIIQGFARSPVLKNYKVQRIELGNPAQINFTLANNLPALEVKIGSDYIKDKLGILESLLLQTNNKNRQINYIDLRFKEPVIKYYDAK